jgi:hypothetical protein
MKPAVDDFLFGGGLKLEDYFIQVTPVSEVLCYVGPGGREFYLPISDDELADAALLRLRELGVRIVQLG